MRVRTLEALLGQSLFARNNASCELTVAGRQFYGFARSLVRVWEEARHQLAVPERYTDMLGMAGQYSLWSGYLDDWLLRFRNQRPKTPLRATAGMPRLFIADLLDGLVDIAVLHAAERRLGLEVEELFEDRLILVTTDAAGEFRDRYVFVDWGDAFREMHAEALPELHSPGLNIEMGPLGVQMLLQMGGAGYLPERIVRPHLESGALHRAPGAPTFLYPAYAVYRRDSAGVEAVVAAIALLRSLAAQAGTAIELHSARAKSPASAL